MTRVIFHIFDIMLKIIALWYGIFFLKFVGIDAEIDEILNVEIDTMYGERAFLDFLCLLKDGTIKHFEFHYKILEDDDLDRYFRYNILSEGLHGKLTETIIFRFCKQKKEKLTRKIGKSKTFNIDYFYLGSVDFKYY